VSFIKHVTKRVTFELRSGMAIATVIEMQPLPSFACLFRAQNNSTQTIVPHTTLHKVRLMHVTAAAAAASAGLMCMVLGLVSNSLPATMAVLVMLSVTCQQSAGLSFGVVPFVSKRSTGLVAGFVGAGGNVGELLRQLFKALRM
jgi:hypothetical protein